jgi:hypothetical protein
VIGDARKHIRQPGGGIDIVQLHRPDQRIRRRRVGGVCPSSEIT